MSKQDIFQYPVVVSVLMEDVRAILHVWNLGHF